jgi:hypothetical protein
LLFSPEDDYYTKLYWPDGKQEEYISPWDGYKEYP